MSDYRELNADEQAAYQGCVVEQQPAEILEITRGNRTAHIVVDDETVEVHVYQTRHGAPWKSTSYQMVSTPPGSITRRARKCLGWAIASEGADERTLHEYGFERIN